MRAGAIGIGVSFPIGGLGAGVAGEAPLVTGNSNTVVVGGVTWTLSTAVDYGATDTGIVTVDWVPGLQILSRSPAATTDGGLAVNGTTKNPQRIGGGTAHAWHEAASGYSAGAALSFPASVSNLDIVVGAVNETGSYTNPRVGLNTSYSGLYFKSGGLPVGAVAPALIGWSGRGTPTAYSLDLDAAVAALPSPLSLAGMTYQTVADCINRLDRLEIAVGATEDDVPEGYEALLTNELGLPNNSNYGRYIGQWYAAAALHLRGDVATTEQKKTLLKSLVRHGVQSFDPVKGGAVVPRTYGGHFQFHEVPVAIALHYLGRTTDLDNLRTIHPGNMLGQTFTYDATRLANLAPHSSLSLPLVSRRRTIVDVDGLNITVTTDRTGETGDLARMAWNGLLLVRESDGATAEIGGMITGSSSTGTDDLTSINSGTDYKGCTIDAQPGSPFAVSNVVYLQSQDPIYEDDNDWRERTGEWAINPSAAQDYREINFFADDVLALRALGIWRDDWASAERYVAMANQSNLPAIGRDFPNHFDGTFPQQFWDAYALDVLGSYPVVLERVAIFGTGEVDTDQVATPAVVAPASGLTRSYQWYKDGAAITGETTDTYTVVSGDIGSDLTVWETITNSEGTQISRSAALAMTAAYAPNAVNFDGTDWGYIEGLSSIDSATQGALSFTFRQNSAWQPGTYILYGANSGGSARFRVEMFATRTFLIQIFDSSGNSIAGRLFSNNEFDVGTYYTVCFSWDTVAEVMVGKKRPDGGSWSDIGIADGGIGVPDGVNDSLARFAVGATNIGGSGALSNCDLHDVWVSFGQLPDFTDSAVLAKFLPTVSKGPAGSLPTGTAPDFFFGGATGTWLTNEGTAGGLDDYGTLTTASAQPT